LLALSIEAAPLGAAVWQGKGNAHLALEQAEALFAETRRHPACEAHIRARAGAGMA